MVGKLAAVLTLCCASTANALLPLAAAAPHIGSRRAVGAALALALTPKAYPAEPMPAVTCDDECMVARVARKQELLRNQSRKAKTDAKIVFGGDYQAGKREAPSAGKIPVVGEFLFPTDVGGINLQVGGKAVPAKQ